MSRQPQMKMATSLFLTFVMGVISSLIAWGLTQSTLSVLITVTIFIILIMAFYRLYPPIRRIVIFNQSGIVNIYQNQSDAEDAIRTKLQTARAIDILTIRGLGILGLKESLLKQMLIDRAGQITIRVLYLNPNSIFVEQRAKEIKENHSTFVHGILLCQKFLSELKYIYKLNIGANMYDDLPIWRMIILDDTAFVSSYIPSCEGHNSAMYEIKSGQKYSLYCVFKRYFEYLYGKCPSGI